MPTDMTGVAALAIISAGLVPFVTALFTHPAMTPTKKRIISFSVAAVLGLVSAIITGQLGWIPDNLVAWINSFVLSVGVVVVAAQGFYKQFRGAVETLEFKTSPQTYVPEIEPNVADGDPEEVGDDEIVVEEGALPEGDDR